MISVTESAATTTQAYGGSEGREVAMRRLSPRRWTTGCSPPVRGVLRRAAGGGKTALKADGFLVAPWGGHRSGPSSMGPTHRRTNGGPELMLISRRWTRVALSA